MHIFYHCYLSCSLMVLTLFHSLSSMITGIYSQCMDQTHASHYICEVHHLESKIYIYQLIKIITYPIGILQSTLRYSVRVSSSLWVNMWMSFRTNSKGKNVPGKNKSLYNGQRVGGNVMQVWNLKTTSISWISKSDRHLLRIGNNESTKVPCTVCTTEM